MESGDEAGSAGVSPAMPPGTTWHSRGYLPHFDEPGLIQMITFRLADALPNSMLTELDRDPKIRNAARRQRMEESMDAGYGACHLGDARVARIVETAFRHFDGVKYRLLAWVVMPNHVHVLVETTRGHSLSEIVQSWKSFTAKEAGKLLGLPGRFWQPEYYDRAIRDEDHLESAVR